MEGDRQPRENWEFQYSLTRVPLNFTSRMCIHPGNNEFNPNRVLFVYTKETYEVY